MIHNPGLFSYGLKRIINDNHADASVITPSNYTDTVFIDSNINTEEDAFKYVVYLYENNRLIDSSSVASSVRLTGDAAQDFIALQWQAEVPWSINTQAYPYHIVFRDHIDENNPEKLLLLDSTDVNHYGFQHFDSAITSDTVKVNEYCYYVETYGSYGNPRIHDPLINRSQIFCIHKFDSVPPCTPEISLENNSVEECRMFLSDKPCDLDIYENRLSIDMPCETINIAGYNIYFSDARDEPLSLLAFTDESSFVHQDLPSFIGCYAVSAVNYSDYESVRSQVICNDNCPSFELPNVFTPNKDGSNDLFTEFNTDRLNSEDKTGCPRFVKHVEFSVFNRLGVRVYKYDSNDDAEGYVVWDGIDEMNKTSGYK